MLLPGYRSTGMSILVNKDQMAAVSIEGAFSTRSATLAARWTDFIALGQQSAGVVFDEVGQVQDTLMRRDLHVEQAPLGKGMFHRSDLRNYVEGMCLSVHTITLGGH